MKKRIDATETELETKHRQIRAWVATKRKAWLKKVQEEAKKIKEKEKHHFDQFTLSWWNPAPTTADRLRIGDAAMNTGDARLAEKRHDKLRKTKAAVILKRKVTEVAQKAQAKAQQDEKDRQEAQEEDAAPMCKNGHKMVISSDYSKYRVGRFRCDQCQRRRLTGQRWVL